MVFVYLGESTTLRNFFMAETFDGSHFSPFNARSVEPLKPCTPNVFRTNLQPPSLNILPQNLQQTHQYTENPQGEDCQTPIAQQIVIQRKMRW